MTSNVNKDRRPCRSHNRYIASDDILAKYDAQPLKIDSRCDELHDIHEIPFNKAEQETIIGIKISSWCISTRSSTIANEQDCETLTSNLEQLANIRLTEMSAMSGDVSRKRRLSLPESVYMHASVNIRRDDDSRQLIVSPLRLSFDAIAALSEWSHCHSYLSNDVPVYRGVSILKSIDAKLWSQQHRIIPTDFNYDWTYSTPYAGSILSPSSDSQEDTWMPCDESGFDMTLLTDQSLPILYYDEIKLFEDDMHDNGYTSLTCKIRVMPTCLLFLMSLFVRVDYVLVRVKETRIFIKFKGISEECTTTIWREVTWRECEWEQLGKIGLPNHVQAWRLEDHSLTGKELQLHQQKIQTMIRSLPLAPLPPDLPKVSHLKCY